MRIICFIIISHFIATLLKLPRIPLFGIRIGFIDLLQQCISISISLLTSEQQVVSHIIFAEVACPDYRSDAIVQLIFTVIRSSGF